MFPPNGTSTNPPEWQIQTSVNIPGQNPTTCHHSTGHSSISPMMKSDSWLLQPWNWNPHCSKRTDKLAVHCVQKKRGADFKSRGGSHSATCRPPVASIGLNHLYQVQCVILSVQLKLLHRCFVHLPLVSASSVAFTPHSSRHFLHSFCAAD